MNRPPAAGLSRSVLLPAGLLAAGALVALLLSGPAGAAGLDDAGVTQCANLTQNGQACPQTGFPSQDAETGRDAQAGLQKAGAGPAGFDYTKLDAAGQPLPDSAASWDCVRDNVTGLIWEIKTDDGGLRDKDWAYTWYNPVTIPTVAMPAAPAATPATAPCPMACATPRPTSRRSIP